MIQKYLLPGLGVALFLAACQGAAAQDSPVSRVQPPEAPSAPFVLPTPPDVTPPAAPPAAAPATPVPAAAADAGSTMAPSWETQKQARTYVLQIPAPRGQITDRDGKPLAQTRVSWNLAILFPALPDAEAVAFARQQAELAAGIVRKTISFTDEQVIKHCHNRPGLPFDIATDLSTEETATVRRQAFQHLMLNPVYMRFYPNGPLAGQIIGYVGRSGRQAEGPIQNNDTFWPVAEGREGLEQTFNAQLTGKNGQMNMNFDAHGQMASEKIVIAPQPGANVITTLDEHAQRVTEEILGHDARRGAIVLVDATNGDIVAMASTPSYNPNAFVPTISAEAYKALADDPNIPLLPRAFRSAYPPGSTFKVPVGIAALESGAIGIDDEFPGPGSIRIGNMTFRNWKKGDAGMLDFVGALTQSCDTWFYQVGIKTGAQPIIDWAQKMGFGAKTGIPLASEAEGRVPTQEYMKKVYGRKFLDGDLANLSIGQGDLLVTPLQMAEAMAAVGNGGTLYRARLVQQVQSYNSQIITAYTVAAKDTLGLDPQVMDAVRKGMIAVVDSPLGTAGKANIEAAQIAGKTGTAQWGPKNKPKDAAWFAGFVPADNPRYAFAAVYEGEVGESTHGGTYCAPMIGKIMQELFKDDARKDKKKGHSHHRARPTPPADEPPPADTNER